MFGKNTMERRRTVSTSSMNMNIATENILRRQHFRTEKLNTLRKTQQPPLRQQEKQPENQTTYNNDTFAVHSVQISPPYQKYDSSLTGPSRQPPATQNENPPNNVTSYNNDAFAV